MYKKPGGDVGVDTYFSQNLGVYKNSKHTKIVCHAENKKNKAFNLHCVEVI